jgi:putative membrane protein
LNFILRLAGSVVAVWLTVQLGGLLDIGLKWKSIMGALLFVIVLALLNAIIRPLVKAFTLPLTCLTFGLFAFVINAIFFWAAARLTDGLDVRGIGAAFFGSIVLSILSGIINSLIKHRAGQQGSRGR